MPLNSFQDAFKNIMLRPRSELEHRSYTIEDNIVTGNVSANDRLGVYHNNIIGSLSNALCATFPMIDNLVGQDFLKEMARQFIFLHPPKSACLHHYGKGFDKFIREYTLAKNLPYLGDVAAFELALNHAYYADDDDALTAQDLSQIPVDSLANTSLTLRRSGRLISSPFPLIKLREFCLNDTDAPDMSIHAPNFILIHRPQLEVQITPLTHDEFDFITLCQDMTLGPALEKMETNHPNFDFTAFIQKHISLETFRKNNANTHLR